MPKLILPNGRPARPDLWIAVKMDPMDNNCGEFFVSHARNYAKFANRPGFTVIAHSYDRVALSIFVRQATREAGPAYQPKFSAFRQERPKLVGDNPDYAPPPSDLSGTDILEPSAPEDPDLDVPEGFFDDLNS